MSARAARRFPCLTGCDQAPSLFAIQDSTQAFGGTGIAVVFSGPKWQADDLTFSPAVGPGRTTDLIQTSFFPGSFNHSFHDVSGSVHLRAIPVTQSWADIGTGRSHVVFGTDLTLDAAQSLTGGDGTGRVKLPFG